MTNWNIGTSSATWRKRRNELPEQWWMPSFDAASMSPREGQLMAFAAATEMFSTESTVDRLGILAGTGSGKSAIAFALADAAKRAGYRKVIISTASISLAQQYERDMEKQSIALPHRYAVSSGLENTLCRLALDIHNEENGTHGVPVEISARSTRFSVNPISKEHKHLSVRAAKEAMDVWPCYPRPNLDYVGCGYRYGSCEVYAQRDRAYDADVIVANAIQVSWLLARMGDFDSDDVFLIVDEADKAVQQLPLDMWGAYPSVDLDSVLSIPSKIVFMSGTLTEPIAERLGCDRYVVLPFLDRSNAPVLVDNHSAWYDRLHEFAARYGDLPGMVVVPNSRMRDVAREVIEEAGSPTVDYDMNTNRPVIKKDHIEACDAGKTPPVLLGFHAGAGIGLDLPGDYLRWLVIVGRPYGSDCSEDREPIRDEAERSDNLIVQAIGRGCRSDGDECRIMWLTYGARDVERVVDRLQEEIVPVFYSNHPGELTEWLNGEPSFSWASTKVIDLDEDW